MQTLPEVLKKYVNQYPEHFTAESIEDTQDAWNSILKMRQSLAIVVLESEDTDNYNRIIYLPDGTVMDVGFKPTIDNISYIEGAEDIFADYLRLANVYPLEYDTDDVLYMLYQGYGGEFEEPSEESAWNHLLDQIKNNENDEKYTQRLALALNKLLELEDMAAD